MKVAPASTTSRRRSMPLSWSGYSPQTFGPVSCIAPYPIRPTVSSPPMVTDGISFAWWFMSARDDRYSDPAAIDVDDGAVDELRFVGGEVYRCVCDRVRRAERPVRGAVHHRGGGIVLDRGPHHTGGDRVDAHARRPELTGSRSPLPLSSTRTTRLRG